MPIMVRVSQNEADAIDRWIAKNGPPYISRPEAIRRLVQKSIETD